MPHEAGEIIKCVEAMFSDMELSWITKMMTDFNFYMGDPDSVRDLSKDELWKLSANSMQLVHQLSDLYLWLNEYRNAKRRDDE